MSARTYLSTNSTILIVGMASNKFATMQNKKTEKPTTDPLSTLPPPQLSHSLFSYQHYLTPSIPPLCSSHTWHCYSEGLHCANHHLHCAVAKYRKILQKLSSAYRQNTFKCYYRYRQYRSTMQQMWRPCPLFAKNNNACSVSLSMRT